MAEVLGVIVPQVAIKREFTPHFSEADPLPFILASVTMVGYCVAHTHTRNPVSALVATALLRASIIWFANSKSQERRRTCSLTLRHIDRCLAFGVLAPYGAKLGNSRLPAPTA